MANILRGRIIEIRPTQTITLKTGSQFSKRELILDCTRHDPYTGERGYENTPCIIFTQDKCLLLDSFQPGMIVEVAIDITGRRSADPNRPGQYYNDIRGYKIEAVQAARLPQHPSPQPQPQPQPAPQPAPQPQWPPQQPYAPQGYPQYPQNPFPTPTGDPF